MKPKSLQRSQPARCPMERLLIPQGIPSRPSLRRVQERGWESSLVRLAFGDCSAIESHSEVSVTEAQAAVLRAVETWNRITLPVKFFVDAMDPLPIDAGTVDVLVQWHFAVSDTENLLNAQTHAHADYPPPNTLYGGPPLPMHFNADLLWGIEEAGRYDIETVALHELAHLLGLIYHTGPDTILYDAIGPAPVFVQHRLDPETIHRAQSLYS